MRAVIVVWAVLLAAVAWLGVQMGILPRWGAVTIWGCLALGVWASWVILTPRGAHADRAGLAVSPVTSPAQSMQLDHDEEWQQARPPDRSEPDWWADFMAGWETPKPMAVGVDSGAHLSGPALEQPWPPYMATGMASPDPAGPGGDAAAPWLVELPASSQPPGPAEPPSGAGVNPPAPALEPWPPSPREADTAEAFRAPLFADCLAFMRQQDADVRAYLASMADDAATYLLQLRGAW